MHNSIIFDYLLKVVVIGDTGVGKSCIVRRFLTDEYDDESCSTIGVDFEVKTVRRGPKLIKMSLWDTAGQERFRTLTGAYYRGCHAVVLVYDVGSRDSFEHVRNWLYEIEMYTSRQHLAILLIGNKTDCEVREVSASEGEALSSTEALIFVETSAKTSEGVKAAFDLLVDRVMGTEALLVTMGVDRATSSGIDLSEARPSIQIQSRLLDELRCGSC